MSDIQWDLSMTAFDVAWFDVMTGLVGLRVSSWPVLQIRRYHCRPADVAITVTSSVTYA